MAEKQVVAFGPFKDFIADGVRMGDTIHLSGAVSVDDEGKPLHPGNIVKQAQQAYAHIAGLAMPELMIEIKVDMNPDATVGNAAIVDIDRALTDPAFRAAAESALRATKNPRCQPLPLPLDQYQQWRTMTLNFDPSGML